MKKTLFITYFFPPKIGGIENYYDNLLSRLNANQVVVLTNTDSEAKDFDKSQNYKIIRTDFFSGVLPPRWWRLKKQIDNIIKQEGIEQIVFGHFHPLCILGNYFGLPYFVFGHGTDIMQVRNSLWQKWVFNSVYKHCQGIVANSEFIANEIKNIVGDKTKVKVVHPGINFKTISQKVENLADKKKLLSIGDNDLVMLSVGRLVKDKGYDKIIKLMPSLIKQIGNLKYIILGDGQEMKSLENLIGQLGLKDRVILAGKITDTKKKVIYYQMAHLFVGVSRVPEGFGIGYLEAQSAGTPVVAGKLGGAGEAVLDNKTGLLADPKIDKDIMFMILKILTDQKLWQEFSTEAVKWAEEFDWDGQVEKVRKILE